MYNEQKFIVKILYTKRKTIENTAFQRFYIFMFIYILENLTKSAFIYVVFGVHLMWKLIFL